MLTREKFALVVDPFSRVFLGVVVGALDAKV